MSSTPETYIETNQNILQRIFSELRWAILEERICRNSTDPLSAAAETMFYTSPADNPNHSRLMQLLQQPIQFDGSHRKITKANYYVIKHRLTKYNTCLLYTSDAADE